MKILITGALGNLGLMCIEQAKAQGLEVIAFDLDTPHNQQRAKQQLAEQHGLHVVLGDIRNTEQLTPLLSDVDAIIHNAAMLPPATDQQPELAFEINVRACQSLIDMAAAQEKKPVFIFPSSVTVFGPALTGEGIKTVQDSVQASDNYTRHKLAIEQYLQDAGIPWVIMRVGVSVDTNRKEKIDKSVLLKMLSLKASNPVEYVHPKDVALAMCNACSATDAVNKVLLIGGGPSCQISQYEFITSNFSAFGLGLKRETFGNTAYYTHWMSTTEAQNILQFQQHSFQDYVTEMNNKNRWVRRLLRPLSWLINPLFNYSMHRQVKAFSTVPN